MASLTQPLSLLEVKRLEATLQALQYQFKPREHAFFLAQDPLADAQQSASITVYKKGPKVLVQGKGAEHFMRTILAPLLQEKATKTSFTPHIGVDESGKGDYLGPLVIAGVYGTANAASFFRQKGVMDSKAIKDTKKIHALAEAIYAHPESTCHVLLMIPEKYNAAYAHFKNLNKLLAWGHAQTIARIIEKEPSCSLAISDQFSKRHSVKQALLSLNIHLSIREYPRAESDTMVAAASILARQRFLQWMEKSSHKAGITLAPGGGKPATSSARAILQRYGKDFLPKIAKTHFKNTQNVLSF